VKPFTYARPESLDEVFALLGEYGASARLLAGGTDVMVRLRAGRTPPRVVIDLKRVAALRGDVEEFKTHVRIGARAVMSSLIADERIRRHFPALVEAASVVGSVQIRNRATLAGNICNASPAADSTPVLLAHLAVVNLIGAAGARSVPLTEFFTGPGRTVVSPVEMVESIDLPFEPEPSGAAFGRITRRYGVDLATINLCCLVSKSGEVRFAYGAVGPIPFLVRDEGGVLADPLAGTEEKDAVLQRLIAHAAPITDVRGSREYREAMLLVMSRRALELARGRLP
jgi:CO/xanthine dehydrogenase FAD-binding subunit